VQPGDYTDTTEEVQPWQNIGGSKTGSKDSDVVMGEGTLDNLLGDDEFNIGSDKGGKDSGSPLTGDTSGFGNEDGVLELPLEIAPELPPEVAPDEPEMEPPTEDELVVEPPRDVVKDLEDAGFIQAPEQIFPEEVETPPTPEAVEPEETMPADDLPEIAEPEVGGELPIPDQVEEPEPDSWQGPTGPVTEDNSKRYEDEFQKYLDYIAAGSPPPPDYNVQDMGISDESWNDYTQNILEMDKKGELPSQWKPGDDGSFTYTGDDGSTITIDEGGNIIGVTDAPPGVLPGEIPVGGGAPVGGGGAPVGGGGTPVGGGGAPVVGGGTPVVGGGGGGGGGDPSGGTPRVQSSPDFGALLALLGGGNRGGAPATQTAPADVQLMEEIFGTNLFSKDPGGISVADAKAGKRNFNDGGSIDELLHLLRG
jgi:hypothetical protein